MKLIPLLLLSLFLNRGCSDSEQMKETILEYSANSRGFFQRITVQDQHVMVSRDRNGLDKPQKQKISDADWKKLVTAFQKVKLERLSELPSPTERRFYDGAAIAKLKVVHEKMAYETTDFDHGEPPAEIKELVNRMIALVKVNEDE
jgi:hypothetical protein